MQELLRSEQTTRLDELFLSQPVCTAVQLALVDTPASWSIISSAVVGHSSGEIAAAYAAGALDFAAAIKIAYFRGLVSATVPERCGRRGAMLAVGLGRAAAEERIRQSVAADVGTVTVACVNSPASTTVSGDAEAVQQLCTSLQADGVFARILKVGVAYHSHHMHAVADEYLRLLQGCIDPKPARPDVHFFSSVTGGHMADTTALTAQYWVRNMVSPVLFADAAAALCTGTLQGKATTQRRRRTAARDGVDILVEIGPHAALSGPLKQILAEKKQQQIYGPVLVLGKDAVNTTLDLVIMLTTRGYEAHLDAVNFPHGRASSVKVLQDLPPYAWNHTTVHWAESRIGMGYRFRKFPRHDLVGAPVGDFNPTEPRWRNFIRLSENPWVADHQVARRILYPAAGMMVMAIEAMRQMLVIGDVQTVIEGYELRDVNIGKALVVPESAEGVETMLVMRPVTASARSSSDLWHEFRIFSVSKVEGWVEHSRGRIAYRFRQPPSVVDGGWEAAQHAADIAEAYTISREACVNKIDVQDLYASLDAIGLSYGETFRNITSMAGGPGRSFGTIKIANTRDAMPYQFEHSYLIHPATLDCALQAMFPALAPAGTTVETAMVPTFVRSMFISSEISSEPGHEYEAWSEARFEGFKSTTARVTVVDSHDTTAVRPIIEISGMECASLADQSTPTDDDGQTRPPKLCFIMDWDVDVNLMTQADLERLSPVRPADEQDRKQIVTHDMYRDSMGIDRCYEHMAAYMDKLAHKYPTLRVLEIGAGTGGATLPMLQTLGGRGSGPRRKHYGRLSSYDFTDISTGFFEKARENFKDWAGLVHFRKLDIEQRPVEQGFDEGTYDVVVAANVLHATRQMRVTLDHVRRLLKPDGKLVLMEITERTLRMTLTLGNLPGWWLGAAEGRVEGPSFLPDYLNVSDRFYSAITATAVEAVEHALPPILVVPPTEASTSPMTTVDRVIESIRATTVSRVSLSQLAAANAAGALIVFLAELESPLLATVSAADFDAIRGAIGAAKGIFWVARGGTVEGHVPEANLITGLSRTIRAEKHALKFVTLDLDGERMVADDSEKDNTNIDPGRPLKLDIGVPGLLDSLRFIDDPMHTPAQDGTEPPPLGQDEVGIDIRATGVNFKDIMVSMGQLVEDFLGWEHAAWWMTGCSRRRRTRAGRTSYIMRDAKSQTGFVLVQYAFLQPHTAEEVDMAAKALVSSGQKFAVRSGGHTGWAGSNNIEGGVTMDLEHLHRVEYDGASETVHIGPRSRCTSAPAAGGARCTPSWTSTDGWWLVDAKETLAWRASFMAGHGFECDNVLAYEVVLATGEIMAVGPTGPHADLFRALKGGSNNFGIVTDFSMKAIPCSKVWGGMAFLPKTAIPGAIEALSAFTDNIPNDPDSNLL
ncbi:polyketide synthase [Grosmannia clavigera kw1407]|uniref:Polyketide synthase n=1 Tax=Grosmannia clavigera (strain kw1407 / UAMH 11150) TaxID=655863 RepID=F0XUI9_GROCL|nr:polyketide synthase [Grosmannia clavigera kw1407]EFW98540.1 polyketide synthase [Grosmannia clavigera kw1407]